MCVCLMSLGVGHWRHVAASCNNLSIDTMITMEPSVFSYLVVLSSAAAPVATPERRSLFFPCRALLVDENMK